MRRLLFSTLLSCAVLLPLPAFSTGPAHRRLPALSPQQRALLNSGERVLHFYNQPRQIALLPDTVYGAAITASLHELAPRIGVEALYLLPMPAGLPQQDGFALRLYNVLRSVSTMEGIEYYSASRERMRVFYRESYIVADPGSRDRAPDPLVDIVPASDRQFAFQHDSSFGRNTYALDYRFESGQMGLTMINLTRMSYGILPLVGDRNLEIHLVVIPTDDGLLFYGNCGVRVIGLFGMQDRVQASFTNRIDAIYRWFDEQVRIEFGL
ncbi:MAG: hypothetical protein EA384_01515 [Spirochaetaceae bacterium]|nr:MAG: hypothetical protein EA384_01515 [Spirochaetaceae bacterium]